MAFIEKRPPWFDTIREAIEANWQHHGPCSKISVTSAQDDVTGEWRIVAAPVFQEVYGGEDDGKTVWTGFVFDASDFLAHTLFSVHGLHINNVAVKSYCAQFTAVPMLVMQGRIHGERISLHILLEPIVGSPVVEMIDTIHHVVREMEPRPRFGPQDHQP